MQTGTERVVQLLQWLHNMCEAPVWFPALHDPNVVIEACNLNTGHVVARGSGGQGHEFVDNLCKRPCLKKEKKKNQQPKNKN